MWVSGHMYLIPIMILVYRMLMREENLMRRREASERKARSAENWKEE
jgi:hypothetical protein